MKVLSETYRNRALDVFIRGLNSDISKMLTIQRPSTLPEAYSSCLEIQNLNFRSMTIHNKNFNNTVTVPVNQIFTNRVHQNAPKPLPRLSLIQKNMGYNMQYQQQPYQQQPYQQQHYQQQPYQQQQNNRAPPSRPFQPKPPVPMDVDESIKTKKINYMNRPNYHIPNPKRDRSPDTRMNLHKQQRVFHLEQQDGETAYEEYINNYSDIEDDEAEEEEDNIEINFTTNASQAYLT